MEDKDEKKIENMHEDEDVKKLIRFWQKVTVVSLIVSMIVIFIGYKMLIKLDDSRVEQSLNEYEQEKVEYFTGLKKQFVAGYANSYLVTDKYSKYDKLGLGAVTLVEYGKPMLTLKNNKTNKVYEVETTKDFYFQTATNQELLVTESKDGKSIKIDATGDVFKKGELLSK